jgi:HD-GYP domain-containing protein (c-di-GMP phosphodiesterase class II)
MTSTKAPTVEILLIGLTPIDVSFMKDLLDLCHVSTAPFDLEKLMEPFDPGPHIILAGTPPGDIPIAEVAQALKMNYQENPIYCLWTKREGYERKDFVKNGFTDAFLLPMEATSLKKTFRESLSLASQGAIRTYRTVKLIDIEPGSKLDFETAIYLPVNKKYITYSAAGDPIDPEQIEKLKKFHHNTIHVPHEQIQKFYEYTAKKLAAVGNNTQLSETERREKAQESVRNLIGGMFTDSAKELSFDQGKQMMGDCQEIVKNYVINSGSGGDWFAKLSSVAGEASDSYAHSTNVSTYAAMFAMGLGVGKPEDLALAGLLHDVGLADLPAEVSTLPESEMSNEQKAEYFKHPELSVNLIKTRKIVVPESVTKAILQHHERYGGKGFPKGLIGTRIAVEAQVLSLADRFDELTAMRTGWKTLTPIEALNYLLKESQDLPPDQLYYDPGLLNKFAKLFAPPSAPEATKAA